MDSFILGGGSGCGEQCQDSDGVNESFWDGQGVEIEAHQFLKEKLCLGLFDRVENIARIRMVVARASGTVGASRLRRFKF